MFDSTILIKLVTTKMPYGKYKGWVICDIPSYYLEWMSSKGFSTDNMGMLLSTMFEIKTNGLDSLLVPIRKKYAQK